MPRGKHTRCSQCRRAGEFRYLEVMWRLGSRGPWHFVGGWLCAADRAALVGFISQLGDDLVVHD